MLNNSAFSDGLASENLHIEAINVTMLIPELVISRSGIEFSNATINADFFTFVKTDNNSNSLDISSNTDEATNELLFEYRELSSSINPQLNPCDDFYQFVCSGWHNSNVIQNDKTAVNQFGIIAETIENRIKSLLDDRSNFKSLQPYDSLIFTLYDACLNTTNRNAAGSSMITNNLASLKQSKMQYITDWLINVYPITLFYAIGVGPDLRQTSRNILMVQPNNLFFGNEKYYIEPNFDHYIGELRKYLRRILELLIEDDKEGRVFKNSSAEIERRINSFIQVETEMAKIQNNTDKHYDDAYADDVDLTVQEFQDTIAGSINWSRYIQAIMPKEISERLPNGIASITIHVSGVEIIKQYEQLARNLSGQVLSDFMDWRVILSDIGYLDDRFLDAGFQLDRVLQGAQQRPTRQVECKTAATSVFTPLIERVFIQKYFDNATRPQMIEIFRNIQDAFRDMLQGNTWMDYATKLEALNKLTKLNLQVGYMDSIFDDNKLNKIFGQLNLDANMNFPIIMKTTAIWSLKRNLYQLLEPAEIEFASFSVNGFYYAVRNAIVITAGMLQGAFYNSSRSSPMNYGSIGAVLAHEITHGYDNSGRLHDENGNVRDWWHNDTKENFRRKKQCFIDQYNDIEVPDTLGLHINGENTQGENIADNGGIRAAYLAMEKSLQNQNHVNPKTKGIVRGLEQYNPKQLFFMNYAFSWCTKQRSEATIFNILNDNHSPANVRVNIVLGNLPQFAETFNCPAGSVMNPTKKCSVW
ncbi:peptidase family m13 domain-containing protein [Ditylenchus destructor]|nr:peptidase family m13 domain-containing protein [Ditylenchus destructor]